MSNEKPQLHVSMPIRLLDGDYQTRRYCRGRSVMCETIESGTERLLDALGVSDADILHRTVERFKTITKRNHIDAHGYKTFWRKCDKLYCAQNVPIIEEAEKLLYGEVQDD